MLLGAPNILEEGLRGWDRVQLAADGEWGTGSEFLVAFPCRAQGWHPSGSIPRENPKKS